MDNYFHQVMTGGVKNADRIMLALLGGNAGFLFWMGTQHGDEGWRWWGLPLLCVGLIGHMVRNRWPGARHLVLAMLVAVVAAQIQLATHLPVRYLNGVMVVSWLVVSQRWPWVLAAGVLFGAQFVAAEWGHPRVVVGIVLLGLHSAWMARLAWAHQRLESEWFDIDFLIKAMGRGASIRLNLDVVRADSAVGKRLKEVQHRMAVAIGEVQTATSGVQGAVSVLNTSSDELRERTTNTASGLRDVAMCLEQINVIVQSSAEASKQARAQAALATERACQGQEQVSQVVHTMEAIERSSRQITEITSVIEGIAFQTNLLALNAAVEAARAGEQGRGFAVVAAEVRNLAKRSSEAAHEIKRLIDTSVNTVQQGAKLVGTAGQTMSDIVDAVKGVGEAFDQLSQDNSEHADGIGVVTEQVKELGQVTQRNIAVAQQAADVARELTVHASAMTEVLKAFKAVPQSSGASAGRHADDGIASSRGGPVKPHAEPLAPTPAAGATEVEYF